MLLPRALDQRHVSLNVVGFVEGHARLFRVHHGGVEDHGDQIESIMGIGGVGGNGGHGSLQMKLDEGLY